MSNCDRGIGPLPRLALALLAALPAACAAFDAPPARPANPFAGTWANPDKRQIAFRDDTVMIAPPNQPPLPLAPEYCEGKFRFAYGRRSRDALLRLAPRQPDLSRRLAAQLVQPEYEIAELACGDGGTIYVLLAERDLLAIHRDRDIAAIERLTR